MILQTSVVDSALNVGKGISEFGMMAITAGFFLVLSAVMMVTFFKWFMKVINGILDTHGKTMNELLKKTEEQNKTLETLSEGLMPENQLRIKMISNMAFDLAIEKVCRIIKKVREENNIADKEKTDRKVRMLVSNVHNDIATKFDNFRYRGRHLSSYMDDKWIDGVTGVIEGELYNDAGPNNKRAFTNVEAYYSTVRLEMYQNMTEE